MLKKLSEKDIQTPDVILPAPDKDEVSFYFSLFFHIFDMQSIWAFSGFICIKSIKLTYFSLGAVNYKNSTWG